MACRTGCKTKDCESYAACLKGANINLGDLTGTRPKAKSELTAYADARRQGIQPAGTSIAQTQAAVEASNRAGKAWDASTESFKKAA